MNCEVFKKYDVNIFSKLDLTDIQDSCTSALKCNALEILRFLFRNYPTESSQCGWLFYSGEVVQLAAGEFHLRISNSLLQSIACPNLDPPASDSERLEQNLAKYAEIMLRTETVRSGFHFNVFFNACYCRYWSEVLLLIRAWKLELSFCDVVRHVLDKSSDWKQEDLFVYLVHKGCLPALRWCLQQISHKEQNALLDHLKYYPASDYLITLAPGFCALVFDESCHISGAWMCYLVFITLSIGQLTFLLTVLKKHGFAKFSNWMSGDQQVTRTNLLDWVMMAIGDIDVEKLNSLFAFDTKLAYSISYEHLSQEGNISSCGLFNIAKTLLNPEEFLQRCHNSRQSLLLEVIRQQHVYKLNCLLAFFPTCTDDILHVLHPNQNPSDLFLNAASNGDVFWFVEICTLFKPLLHKLFETPDGNKTMSKVLLAAVSHHNFPLVDFLVRRGCGTHTWGFKDSKSLQYFYSQQQNVLVTTNLSLPTALKNIVLEFLDYFSNNFHYWRLLQSDEWHQSHTSIQRLLSP